LGREYGVSVDQASDVANAAQLIGVSFSFGNCGSGA